MPEFISEVTLSTQLLLPALFSGILLVSCLISLFLFKRTKERVYLSSGLFLLFATLFTGCEAAIILTGSVLYNRPLSLEFHRIEQLAGVMMLFVIPFLLYASSPKTWHKVTKWLAFSGGVLAIVITLVAFVLPHLFVSLDPQIPIGPIEETEFGRGDEGLFYQIRDIGLLIIFIYSMFFFLKALKSEKNRSLIRWYMLGVEICFFLAFCDIVNVYWSYKLHIPPVLDFSYAAMGFSIFGILVTYGVFEKFLKTLYDREVSLKRVQRLAHVGGVEWCLSTDSVRLSDELLRSFHIPESDRELSLTSFLQNYTSDEGTSYFSNSLEKTLNNKVVDSFVSRITTPNGHSAWALFTAPEIVEVKKGAPETLLWSVQDVTHLREVEEQLFQSQKMDAIGQLAGGVAHDFNNTLSGILGSAELLKLETEGHEEVQELLNVIIDSTERAGDLTRQLLDFSRKGIQEYKPVDIDVALSNCIDLLLHTINKKVVVEKHLNAQAKVVFGSMNQLQNCFLNMGINAGHAMPDGGVLTFATSEIALNQEYCNNSSFIISPGRFVKISIKDTGEGISEENLSNIFEPFFTTKEKGVGTGLGLSSVLDIISQHHGEILVESRVGKGTEFTIHLPLSGSDTGTVIEEAKLHSGSGLILVIDDEPVVRLTLLAILKKLGYQTLSSASGKEAILTFKKHHRDIDVVLLDMLMPDMDGLECLEQLQEVRSDVKVLLNSGISQQENEDDFIQKGITAVLYKPLSAPRLSNVLHEVLSN